MANDNMRTGPRGSSDQAAVLQPITVQLSTYGGVNLQIDESGGVQQIAWSPLPGGNEAGYKVERIYIVTTELYAEEGEEFTIGTCTKNAAGAMVAVDIDAFVTTIKFADATPLGTTTVLTLTGVGAGLDPTTDAHANFLIGGPSNHYLTLTKVLAGSTGAGAYACYADLIPVSGSEFSN